MAVATLHSTTSNRRTRSYGKHAVAHAAIIALGLIMIYPPLWMFASSFKPSQLIFSEPGLWPREITIDNWAQGWVALGIPFSHFFFNSAVIAVLSVIGNLFSCSLAAYAFARLEFRFKPLLFALMLGTIMLPFQVVLVPQYILFHSLGWTNTILPLVVPKFLAVDSFSSSCSFSSFAACRASWTMPRLSTVAGRWACSGGSSFPCCGRRWR